MDLTMFSMRSGSWDILRISASSSSVISTSEKSACSFSTDSTSMNTSNIVDLSRSLFCTERMIPLSVTLLPGDMYPAMSSST